jgi:phospholipase/lecithinase/hemolysin
MRKVALLAAAVALLSGAAAEAATRYSGILFFGDSLSDDGNLHALTSAAIGQGIPPPPYFQGRTSNDLVWADHVAADFTAKKLHSANYAYAYAQAVTNVDTQFGPLQVPDLPAQIDAFKASGTAHLFGDRPVATLWAGANDIFNAMRDDPFSVPLAAASAAAAVAGGIESLAEAGIRDFMVFNMAPLEKTPRFATLGTPEEAFLASLATEVFNETLNGLLDSAGGTARITKIDVHAAMNGIIADPGAYGLGDASHACLIPDPPMLFCTPEQAAEWLFWDPVHPTAAGHALIADAARAEIAPVPLPAPALLLLAGMAGLAAVGARRRA